MSLDLSEPSFDCLAIDLRSIRLAECLNLQEKFDYF
jgi:hypothetical protein